MIGGIDLQGGVDPPLPRYGRPAAYASGKEGKLCQSLSLDKRHYILMYVRNIYKKESLDKSQRRHACRKEQHEVGWRITKRVDRTAYFERLGPKPYQSDVDSCDSCSLICDLEYCTSLTNVSSVSRY